jgi:hypothetical protein
VREIRTLRAMWRTLETEPRQLLTAHEGGNPRYKPRMSLRVTAPMLDLTRDSNLTVWRGICKSHVYAKYASFPKCIASDCFRGNGTNGCDRTET